jgi:hypothetical protein
MNLPALLTTSAAALAIFGSAERRHVEMVRRMADGGQLSTVRVGRLCFIPRGAVLSIAEAPTDTGSDMTNSERAEKLRREIASLESQISQIEYDDRAALNGSYAQIPKLQREAAEKRAELAALPPC